MRHEQNEKLRACSHIFYSVSGLGTQSLVSSDNDYLARRGYRDHPIPHPQPRTEKHAEGVVFYDASGEPKNCSDFSLLNLLVGKSNTWSCVIAPS